MQASVIAEIASALHQSYGRLWKHFAGTVMQNIRILGAAILFALSAACAGVQKTPSASQAFSFPVIGDIPYSDEDRYVLEEQIVPAIRSGGYPFVIHLGDYKGGGVPCAPEHDDAQLALIEELAPIPVFYTPGDNEWTDCDRFDDPETGKRQSELARLEKLRKLFFSDLPPAPDALAYMRQPEAPENATWRYGGMRFATTHIAATGNGRRAVEGDDPADAAAEADRREAAALDWLANVSALAREEGAQALVIAVQADMSDVQAKVLGKPCEGAVASREQQCDAFTGLRAAIREAAVSFGGPTLLIHGDTAPFRLGQSFAGDEAPNLWVLNAAGDHGVTRLGIRYGVQDGTLVTFQPEASAPFSARGLVTGIAAN